MVHLYSTIHCRGFVLREKTTKYIPEHLDTLIYLLKVKDDVGGGLVNLEDVEPPAQVSLLQFQLCKLLPHLGDERQCFCDRHRG